MTDFIGKIFGRLTVIAQAPSRPEKRGRRWHCRCECGGELIARGDQLKDGQCKSCGCLQKEKARVTCLSRATHSLSKTGPYQSWKAMMGRCYHPKHPKYADYGARGITVYAPWHDPVMFLADMGPRPDGHSIERLNNSGNYEPSNCCWASRKAQQNNRRANRIIEFGGLRLTVSQWTDHLGFPKHLISSRLSGGWSIERALTTPVKR